MGSRVIKDEGLRSFSFFWKFITCFHLLVRTLWFFSLICDCSYTEDYANEGPVAARMGISKTARNISSPLVLRESGIRDVSRIRHEGIPPQVRLTSPSRVFPQLMPSKYYLKSPASRISSFFGFFNLVKRNSAFVCAPSIASSLRHDPEFISRFQKASGFGFSCFSPECGIQLSVLPAVAETTSIPVKNNSRLISNEGNVLFPENISSPNTQKEDENPASKYSGPLFSEFPEIHHSVVEALLKNGIFRMTPIQALAFPGLYKGFDMIGRSKTGSGKTLAFLLPLIEKMRSMKDDSFPSNSSTARTPRHRFPSLLILEPTRELAKQVAQQAEIVASVFDFSVLCCYGGASYTSQEKALSRGVDILLGTPGRILEYIRRGILCLKSVRHVVLDEADEMLNMGFSEDVEAILKEVPRSETQFSLFSATTPDWVLRLSQKYLTDALKIDAIGDSNRIPETVQHVAIKTSNNITGIAAMLEDIVTVESRGGQTIIFTRTKRDADKILSDGSFKIFSAAALHGDIGQATRDNTMQAFRKGSFTVLVATDVAARGIDVENVDLVIQCGPPYDADTYIHRSGRTGRAGKPGTSVVLYSEQEAHDLHKLERICGIRFKLKNPPSFKSALSASAKLASQKLDSVSPEVIPYFLDVAADVWKRALAASISESELLARSLALIAQRPKVQSRSLFTGDTDMVTVEFYNEKGEWRHSGEVIYWFNKLTEYNSLGAYQSLGKIYFRNDTRRYAYFDISTETLKCIFDATETNALEKCRVNLRTLESLNDEAVSQVLKMINRNDFRNPNRFEGRAKAYDGRDKFRRPAAYTRRRRSDGFNKLSPDMKGYQQEMRGSDPYWD